MRVNGEPTVVAARQDNRRSPRPREGGAIGPHAKRAPGNDRNKRAATPSTVKLVQAEREVADVRPDVPPLVTLERFAPGDDLGVGAERDDVIGKERTGSFKIHRAHALLQRGEPGPRDGLELSRLPLGMERVVA